MQYMVQFYKENDQSYSQIKDYEITKLQFRILYLSSIINI